MEYSQLLLTILVIVAGLKPVALHNSLLLKRGGIMDFIFDDYDELESKCSSLTSMIYAFDSTSPLTSSTRT